MCWWGGCSGGLSARCSGWPKNKKSADNLSLALVKNRYSGPPGQPFARSKGALFCIGFAAETEQLASHVRQIAGEGRMP